MGRPPSDLPPVDDEGFAAAPFTSFDSGVGHQGSALAGDTTAPYAAGWRPPSALTDDPDLGYSTGPAPLADYEPEGRYHPLGDDPFASGPARPDDATMLIGDVDDDYDSYGADPFGATSYFTQEPTPALLAAKAEPLGDVPPRRPRKVSRPGGQTGPSGPGKGRGSAKGVAKGAAKGQSDRRSRQAPQPVRKEPSKALLALGIAAVILVGVAAGWYFTRSKGTDTNADQAAAPSRSTAAGTGNGATGGGQPEVSTSTTAAVANAAARPAVTPGLSVIFDDAASGPIAAGTAYAVGVQNAPTGSTAYQVLVDNKPVGNPTPALAPVTFTEGRHLLAITVTGPDGKALSTESVVVYATPAQVTKSYRANLASVSKTMTPPENSTAWAEAVKLYDQYLAAGHTKLKLMPSDGYPSLKPGFWNLFVDGFPDAAAATAYCKQFNLSVPDQCFPKLFDPNAPAGG